jgi:hypothetical protein
MPHTAALKASPGGTMFKLKPALFTVAVTVATLLPAAAASAGLVASNHNETLLADA